MPSEDQVRQALATVDDPDVGRPITELGMVRDVSVEGDVVNVHVLLTVPGCPMKDRIEREVRAAVEPLEGVRQLNLGISSMSEQ